jgi:hypothetical protein
MRSVSGLDTVFSGYFLFRGMDTIVNHVLVAELETPAGMAAKYRAQ